MITWLLKNFNPGISRRGKQISGPKWQFPNGTVFERFVNGRANSEKWQRYGPVYRIWSGPHPEMYVLVFVTQSPSVSVLEGL